METTKAKDHRDCMQILVGTPAKILNKARALCTKMVACVADDCGSLVGGPEAQASCLTENVDENSSTSNDEKLKEEVILVSKKRSAQDGSKVHGKLGDLKQCDMGCGENNNNNTRSYSLRLGKIGRIDEEKPCSFNEGDGMFADLYPRSRSLAMMRTLMH